MISSIAAAVTALGVFITPICAYDSAAADAAPLPECEPPEEVYANELTELEGARTELFANEAELDFSFLNGEFTVEVSGASDDSSLLIADCGEDGSLLDVHIINDVQPENTVQINGSYARAFLWELDDMSPQCESITTKTDYPIVVTDGVETIRKGAFYIEYSSGGETYTGVHIPASVTYINPENLTSVNKRPLADITVDPANEYYTVTDGKLVQKGV